MRRVIIIILTCLIFPSCMTLIEIPIEKYKGIEYYQGRTLTTEELIKIILIKNKELEYINGSIINQLLNTNKIKIKFVKYKEKK